MRDELLEMTELPILHEKIYTLNWCAPASSLPPRARFVARPDEGIPEWLALLCGGSPSAGPHHTPPPHRLRAAQTAHPRRQGWAEPQG